MLSWVFTLLLAPFASKLVNYSSHSELLKNARTSINRCFLRKCRRFRDSSECSKTHCASNTWPIRTKKLSKEAWRCKLPIYMRVFSKIFWCKRIVGRQKFVQYIPMLYLGCFILVSTVSKPNNQKKRKLICMVCLLPRCAWFASFAFFQVLIILLIFPVCSVCLLSQFAMRSMFKFSTIQQGTQVQNETVSFRKAQIQFCELWKNSKH